MFYIGFAIYDIMQKDTFMRCMLYSYAYAAFMVAAFLIIFIGEDWGLTDDQIILYSGICVSAMLIVSVIVFIFVRKTSLMKKRPETQFRPIKTAGEEDRRIGIIISSYITSGQVKLFLDNKEIAEGRGGDRFRVSVTSGEHRLSVKAGKDSTEYIIQTEENGDVYIWYEGVMLKADRVEGSIEKMAETDAVRYKAMERILILVLMGTPLSYALVVVVMLWQFYF
jgi:hypothetical protein